MWDISEADCNTSETCGATFSLEEWAAAQVSACLCTHQECVWTDWRQTDTITLVLWLSAGGRCTLWCDLAPRRLLLEEEPVVVWGAPGFKEPFWSSDFWTVLLDGVLALLELVSVHCWGVILHIPAVLCTQTREQELEGRHIPPLFHHNVCFNNIGQVKRLSGPVELLPTSTFNAVLIFLCRDVRRC